MLQVSSNLMRDIFPVPSGTSRKNNPASDSLTKLANDKQKLFSFQISHYILKYFILFFIAVGCILRNCIREMGCTIGKLSLVLMVDYSSFKLSRGLRQSICWRSYPVIELTIFSSKISLIVHDACSMWHIYFSTYVLCQTFWFC